MYLCMYALCTYYECVCVTQKAFGIEGFFISHNCACMHVCMYVCMYAHVLMCVCVCIMDMRFYWEHRLGIRMCDKPEYTHQKVRNDI